MITQIQRAKLNDKDKFFKFLEKAYKERAKYKYPERWLWEYVNNPYNSNGEVSLWFIERNGEIGAQGCVFYVLLKIGSHIRKAAWGVDTMVLPEYRGRGYGPKVLKRVMEDSGIYLALSMTPEIYKTLTHFGGISVDTIQHFIRFERISLKYILDKIVKNENLKRCFARVGSRIWLDRFISAICSLLFGLRDRIRMRGLNPRIDIIEIKRFDDTINTLWDKVSQYYPVIVKRDMIYLNWKFVDQPHINYKRFIAKKEGNITGYVILRLGTEIEPDDAGIISDIFAGPHDSDVIKALIVFSIRYLQKKDVFKISCDVNRDEYKNNLRQLGFIPGEIKKSVFYCKDKEISDLMSDSGNWFLTKGDCDYDQYPFS